MEFFPAPPPIFEGLGKKSLDPSQALWRLEGLGRDLKTLSESFQPKESELRDI